MSSKLFMALVETVATYNTSKGINHKKIIDAAREVMRSPVFKPHHGLHDLTPIETAELPSTNYPNGLYSYDSIDGLSLIRYVVILRLNENSHLYLKLMLGDIDSAVSRYRLAYVHYDGFLTIHHDLERGTISQIKDHLKEQGVEL